MKLSNLFPQSRTLADTVKPPVNATGDNRIPVAGCVADLMKKTKPGVWDIKYPKLRPQGFKNY